MATSPVEQLGIKVCGLTSVEDALMVAAAGANWVGLNFYPRSPRCVDLSKAREIVEVLPEPCKAVGLFVDAHPTVVAQTADRVGLSIVQLHGEEPPEDLFALRHLTLVKAFRLADENSIAKLNNYLRCSAELGRSPDAVLVDAYRPGEKGGTGLLIEDHLLGHVPHVPRLILAGGLTAGNVRERVRMIRPWMVDVASGVESAPGRKDQLAVSEFIAAARHWDTGKT